MRREELGVAASGGAMTTGRGLGRVATLAFACAVALLATTQGCVGPANEGEPLVVGDLEEFAAQVQPALAERCATAACHGRVERPLRLFARGHHRADPDRVYLDEPLDAVELAHNAAAVAAMAHGLGPGQSPIILKPLAESEGGSWHGGGDVFLSLEDGACRSLVGWLVASEGARDPQEGTAP